MVLSTGFPFCQDAPKFESIKALHFNIILSLRVKKKAVALQAWSGPEASRKLRLPDYMTMAQDGGKVVSLTHRPPLPQEMLLVLISVRGCVDPNGHSAIGRILCQWKIPMTPAGIEPATFRFVAQHLNHCATAVPPPSLRVSLQIGNFPSSLLTNILYAFLFPPRFIWCLLRKTRHDVRSHVLFCPAFQILCPYQQSKTGLTAEYNAALNVFIYRNATHECCSTSTQFYTQCE